MSEIIAFEIYRAERLSINGELFTVRFTKRKEGEEYALFAVNDAKTKSWRGFYSREAAADLNRSTGRELEEVVYAILKGDIEREYEYW